MIRRTAKLGIVVAMVAATFAPAIQSAHAAGPTVPEETAGLTCGFDTSNAQAIAQGQNPTTQTGAMVGGPFVALEGNPSTGSVTLTCTLKVGATLATSHFGGAVSSTTAGNVGVVAGTVNIGLVGPTDHVWVCTTFTWNEGTSATDDADADVFAPPCRTATQITISACGHPGSKLPKTTCTTIIRTTQKVIGLTTDCTLPTFPTVGNTVAGALDTVESTVLTLVPGWGTTPVDALYGTVETIFGCGAGFPEKS